MTEEETNMAIVRRFYEELWNRGNYDVADEIFDEHFKGHAPGNTGARGPKGVKKFVAAWRKQVPDLRVEIDGQFAEGSKVATRFRCTGTHTRHLFGIRPTGNPLAMGGFAITRIENGKVVSDWGEFDIIGLLQQLGVVPRPHERPGESSGDGR